MLVLEVWTADAVTRGQLFKVCPEWKAQQKILWAEVREETGRGKRLLKIGGIFVIGRCSQSVLDFVLTADVEKLVAAEVGAGRKESEWQPRSTGSGKKRGGRRRRSWAPGKNFFCSRRFEDVNQRNSMVARGVVCIEPTIASDSYFEIRHISLVRIRYHSCYKGKDKGNRPRGALLLACGCHEVGRGKEQRWFLPTQSLGLRSLLFQPLLYLQLRRRAHGVLLLGRHPFSYIKGVMSGRGGAVMVSSGSEVPLTTCWPIGDPAEKSMAYKIKGCQKLYC